MVSETKQEEEMKQYLLNFQIPFEQHKRIAGCGGKLWVVDFYLPDHSVVVEMKMSKLLKTNECARGGIIRICIN